MTLFLVVTGTINDGEGNGPVSERVMRVDYQEIRDGPQTRMIKLDCQFKTYKDKNGRKISYGTPRTDCYLNESKIF